METRIFSAAAAQPADIAEGSRLEPIRRRSFLGFLRSEDGPTAVEYAVMLSLIVIVCLSAIHTIGANAKTTFTNVANSIAGS